LRAKRTGLDVSSQQREIGHPEVARITGSDQVDEDRALGIGQRLRRIEPTWLAIDGNERKRASRFARHFSTLQLEAAAL
jgi:hypothetical protein